MRKKRQNKKQDIRTIKKSWFHTVLTLSGFALILFSIFSLSLQGIITHFIFGEEIALFLITILTLSFLTERSLHFKKEKIYEVFYSTYLGIMLLALTIIYWISYLNNIDIGPFRTFIVLTLIIIFIYSLITIKHSEKLWYIVVSYAFTALITIIIFGYLYWTLSIFGMGHLQFSECGTINPELISENWLYFSSVTFYALGYGDICPMMNWMRLVSQLEVAAGALINTILIGFIFWKIREKSIEEEIKSRDKK